MQLGQDIPPRRSIRLPGFDYTREGIHFITICAASRMNEFGRVVSGEFAPNGLGEVVEEAWKEIPSHFPHVMLDEYELMPDHIHGLVQILYRAEGTACRAPTGERAESFGKPVAGSIPTIVRSFKSAVTKQANAIFTRNSKKIWQRNYYEKGIRNEAELDEVRKYIQNNPAALSISRSP